jgi:adenylate cyclase
MAGAAGTRAYWLVTLAAAALALLAELGGSAQTVENAGRDAMLRAASLQRTMPANIVLVDIDQRSLEDMVDIGGNWPWPRALHGELVGALGDARAIVFDVLFNEPDTFNPDSDAWFGQVVAADARIYLPTLLMADGSGARAADFPAALRITPLPGADAQARLPLLMPLVVPPEGWRGGLINFHADADGRGRSYWLHRDVNGWRVPSMPTRLAEELGWPVPDDAQRITLNWYADAGIRRHPYASVFTDLTGGTPTLRDEFRDAIVIIGATAPGLGDLRATPISNQHPGVTVLATAIANLQDDSWLRTSPAGYLLYPLIALALLLAMQRGSSPLATALWLAAGNVAAIAAGWLLLTEARLLTALFAPLLFGWLLFAALGVLSWWQERQQRERAVAAFGRFLDPRVVRHLVEEGGVADATATRAREVTLLFSDIRGFTSISERSRPEDIVALLNDYFSRQVKVIFATGGTLDKFIGDAIMAFWGAPADDLHHARHAVEAALAMVDTLEQFRRDLGEQGKDFDVGIGIHSGPAVVGFIGSQDRLDYTAIGDTVNLASRIEGATKGKARILVSEDTRRACGDAFDFIDHGEVHVKGREQGVRLYEPVRRKNP